MTWTFDVEDLAWSITVPGAPTEDTKRRFWEGAVPLIAAAGLPAAPARCVVIARVTAATKGPIPPGGPRGRAKGLLDALHDDRGSGPKYSQMGVRPPLANDNPEDVGGLAVEVRAGTTACVEYRVGTGLQVAGQHRLSLDVNAAGPNDIAGTRQEKVGIAERCVQLAEAVHCTWNRSAATICAREVKAIVVHHHPARDEDNTWNTWTYALCGAARTGPEHWAAKTPLAGANALAFASIADRALKTPTRYSIYS